MKKVSLFFLLILLIVGSSAVHADTCAFYGKPLEISNKLISLSKAPIAKNSYITKVVDEAYRCYGSTKYEHFSPCDFQTLKYSEINSAMRFYEWIAKEERVLDRDQIEKLRMGLIDYLSYLAGEISGCFHEEIVRPLTNRGVDLGLYELEYVMSLLSWYPDRLVMMHILPGGAYYSQTWGHWRDPLETQVLSFNGLSLIDDERTSKVCLVKESNSRRLSCP